MGGQAQAQPILSASGGRPTGRHVALVAALTLVLAACAPATAETATAAGERTVEVDEDTPSRERRGEEDRLANHHRDLIGAARTTTSTTTTTTTTTTTITITTTTTSTPPATEAVSAGTLASATPPPRPPADPQHATRDVSCEQHMYDQINAARASAGLPTLAVDTGIQHVAINWADEMARSQWLRHNPTYGDQILEYRDYRTAGENVGRGYEYDSLFQAFMNSPSHRANIESGAYSHMTVGCLTEGSGQLWVTQNFWGR